MSLTHDADGVGPDLELMLRSELGAVADAVGTAAGPVPVRAVVGRYRTARRRRRAAVAGGAALGTVLAVAVATALPGPAVRSEELPAVRTPRPTGSVTLVDAPTRRPVDDVTDPLSEKIMTWVAALPTATDVDATLAPTGIEVPRDADGAPRVVSPDGSLYATHLQFGDRASGVDLRFELQVRRVSDDGLVDTALVGQDTTPVGWVGDDVLVTEPDQGGVGIPFVWTPGQTALVRVAGLSNSEDLVSRAGDRLLVEQFMLSSRCPAPTVDARVVRLKGSDILRVWEGCSRRDAPAMSPDGRYVVDARSWFTAVDLRTGTPRDVPRLPPPVATAAWERSPDLVWEQDSRHYRLTIPLGVPGDAGGVTVVRCEVTDEGTCVRLPGTA